MVPQDEDGHAAATLAELAPSWCSRVAPALMETSNATPPSLAQSQERLKREFILFVKQLSSERTLLLFLDDVHWADDSTVDLLGYLGDRLGTSSILVLTTYRHTELLLQKHPFLHIKQELEMHKLSYDLPLDLLNQILQ